jgi:protein SCO1
MTRMTPLRHLVPLRDPALSRLRRLALLGLLVGAAAYAVACGSSSGGAGSADVSGTTAATLQNGWYGGILPTPGGKPQFTLTDTSGRPFDFQQQTDGTVTLLYYGYTHCPDVCPTHMATIAGALKDAGPAIASKVKVVFVTTDPERDDAATVRTWLDHFDPSFIGLTGTVQQIEDAEVADGLPPTEKTPIGNNGDYAVTHAAWVTLFAQDNRSHLIYPLGLTQADWVHDLKKIVENGWPQTGS